MGQYNLDNFARDVAIEINLGGDRFDADDVAMCLDGMSQVELRCFAERVKYHSVDFAPKEGYRDPGFLDRAVDGMLSGVRQGNGLGGDEVSRYLLDLNSEENRARGRWFRFSDGTFGVCTVAVPWAMWDAKTRSRLNPVPVSVLDVAKAKADELITKYGKEVSLDGPWDSVDVLSNGGNENGPYLKVRRNVDTLAKGVDDHVYFITEMGPLDGKMTSTALSDLGEGRLNILVDTLGRELEMRWKQEKGLPVEESPMDGPEGSDGIIVLRGNDIVAAPFPDASGSVGFRPERLFLTPDSRTVVSGRYAASDGRVSDSSPAYTFPLEDFSDAGVSVIREATQHVVKRLVDLLPKPDLGAIKGVSKDAGSSVKL